MRGWLGLAALLALPVSAAAQGSSEREARVLFERASHALETGRFAEARDLLRRSLAVVPNAGTAFNLAVALRGTGQTLEAVALFDSLLERQYGELSPGQRREAARLRTETEAEIAVLHIVAAGAARIEVRVDGERVATLDDHEPLEHRVDPGSHVITASARHRRTEERRVELDRGGSLSLRMELEPTEEARTGLLVVEAVHADDVLEIVGVQRGTGTLRQRLTPGEYRIVVSGPAGRRESTVELEPGTTLRVRLEAGSDGLWSSPWWWTGVGAVVVALAVGGLLIFGDREEDPISDPVYGIVTTLRAR